MRLIFPMRCTPATICPASYATARMALFRWRRRRDAKAVSFTFAALFGLCSTPHKASHESWDAIKVQTTVADLQACEDDANTGEVSVQ